MHSVDPDERQNPDHNPADSGQAIDHDLAADLSSLLGHCGIVRRRFPMFGNVVERLNDQPDPDDDCRDRRQGLNLDSGEGNDGEDDGCNPGGTLGQQADGLCFAGKPFAFHISRHFRPPQVQAEPSVDPGILGAGTEPALLPDIDLEQQTRCPEC